MNPLVSHLRKLKPTAHRSLRVVACACLLAALAPLGASAQTPGGSSCSASLARLQAMASARPNQAEPQAELGRCYLALGRSDIAYESFQRAAEAEPTPGRQLDTAVALYHARKLQESEAALDRLADVIPDRADLHFYKGLILLERGEDSAAAQRLDRSRRLSPGRVEPVASYFAGVSYANSGDLARAEEALRRVAHDWAGSPWAAAAEGELAKMRGTTGWHSWAELDAGLEYDSNVALAGRSVSPDEITDHSDFRTTHSLRGGREISADGWYAGVGAGYVGSLHFDQTAFDLSYPSVTAYGFRKLGPNNGVRLQLDTGYAWLGTDPFVFTYDSTFALIHEWGEKYGKTEWFSDFLVRDFRRSSPDVRGPLPGDAIGIPGDPCANGRIGPCGPGQLDEGAKRNRDGIGIRTGLAHSLPVAKPFTFVQLVTALERYNSEGSEYEYDGVEAGLNAKFDIDFGLTGELRSTYRSRWYDHPSTYPDYIRPRTLGIPPAPDIYYSYILSNQKRTEHWIDVAGKVERELLYDLAMSLQVNYEKRFSNTQVFEYSRVYGGIHLTWRPDFN